MLDGDVRVVIFCSMAVSPSCVTGSWPGELGHPRGYTAFLLFPYFLVIPRESVPPGSNARSLIASRARRQDTASLTPNDTIIGSDDDETPGRRASERRGDPLTMISTPTMISAVRCAEEIAQDPRTATVRHPRGETA